MASSSMESIRASCRQVVLDTIKSAQSGDAESIAWIVISILFVLVAVINLLQSFASKRGATAKHQARKTIPPIYSEGLPVIGTLIAFVNDPLGTVWKAYEKHGSIFTLKLLHKRLTFVIGPNVSHVFYKASDTELDQNEPYRFSTPVFGKDVVYDAKLENRLQHFRILSMTLRVNMLEQYIPLMIKEATEFFAQWGSKGEVDLFEELSNLIILTGSRCIMGKEVRENLFGQVSHLIHDLDQGMKPISVLANWLPTKAHRLRDKARKEIAKLFEPVIKSRRESITNNGGADLKQEKHNDMLQWLIDARYKNGEVFKDHEIVGLLIAGLFAAQHTSSATSTWVGMYILRNKEIFNRLIEEQTEILSKNNGQLSYDCLNQMDLLHCCMKEVLRMHPPLIFLMRNVLEPRSALNGQYEIPKNDYLVSSPSVAGRLPNVYTNPDKFDPDRFLSPREEDKKAPYSFLGFGAGRHGCMGEGFAYVQVKTIWTILLNSFELEVLDEKVPPPNMNALVIGPYHKTCYVKYKRKKNPKFHFRY